MGKREIQWDDVEKQLLEKRALDLAKPADELGRLEESRPLLEFILLGTPYAIYLERVESVSRIGDICSIPLTPSHLSGIMRRRGQSIALVSLRHFFNRQEEGLRDADFAVIVTAKGKRFALQVEEIQGVIHIPADSMLPPPDNFDSKQVPFIIGITTEGLAVVDLDSLVDAKGFGMDNPLV